jgi:hypothetical protein
MKALPSHRLRPLQRGVHIGQQRPISMSFQTAPTTFHRIVLAVVSLDAIRDEVAKVLATSDTSLSRSHLGRSPFLGQGRFWNQFWQFAEASRNAFMWVCW